MEMDPLAVFVLTVLGFVLFFVGVLAFVRKRSSNGNAAFGATVMGASIGGGMGAPLAAAAFTKKRFYDPPKRSASLPSSKSSDVDDGFDAAGFAVGLATGVPLSPTHGFSTGAMLGAALHSDPTPAASEPSHHSSYSSHSDGGSYGSSSSYDSSSSSSSSDSGSSSSDSGSSSGGSSD
jgi:hypothetical protein